MQTEEEQMRAKEREHLKRKLQTDEEFAAKRVAAQQRMKKRHVTAAHASTHRRYCGSCCCCRHRCRRCRRHRFLEVGAGSSHVVVVTGARDLRGDR